MGMVLMMVVPGLAAALGETPLMFRMVGLVPVAPACVVVMMVVGLPSAEVTSLRMVPAGSGPFVWRNKNELSQHVGFKRQVRTRGPLAGCHVYLYDLCDGVSGLTRHRRALDRFGLDHGHDLPQTRDLNTDIIFFF